jgi:hypothetical protein
MSIITKTRFDGSRDEYEPPADQGRITGTGYIDEETDQRSKSVSTNPIFPRPQSDHTFDKFEYIY